MDIARIGALAGRRAVGFRRAIRGYTPAERWIVALADGSSAFAKLAVDPLTADGLRTEQRVYAALQGDFMPQVCGWDDGERPLLLLEDLSGCRWPPPWDVTGVDRVLAALASLRAADPGDALPPLSVADRDLGRSWRRVAAAPAEFLSLGLVWHPRDIGTAVTRMRTTTLMLSALSASALLCPTAQHPVEQRAAGKLREAATRPALPDGDVGYTTIPPDTDESRAMTRV